MRIREVHVTVATICTLVGFYISGAEHCVSGKKEVGSFNQV